MRNKLTALMLASLIAIPFSANGSPNSNQFNDHMELVELGMRPVQQESEQEIEPIRTSRDCCSRLTAFFNDLQVKKILKKTSVGVVCFGAAAACAYGCYLSSAQADHLSKEIDLARAPVLSASEQIRTLCRDSESWKTACYSLDPIACQNRDYYKVGVNPYSIIHWDTGSCGHWESLTDKQYREDYQCYYHCTNRCDSEGKNCYNDCRQECYWVTSLVSVRDLSSLFGRCPNQADYQQLISSDQFKNCTKIVDENSGQAAGYVAGAVFGALGAVAFTGCGIWVLGWVF